MGELLSEKAERGGDAEKILPHNFARLVPRNFSPAAKLYEARHDIPRKNERGGEQEEHRKNERLRSKIRGVRGRLPYQCKHMHPPWVVKWAACSVKVRLQKTTFLATRQYKTKPRANSTRGNRQHRSRKLGGLRECNTEEQILPVIIEAAADAEPPFALEETEANPPVPGPHVRGAHVAVLEQTPAPLQKVGDDDVREHAHAGHVLLWRKRALDVPGLAAQLVRGLLPDEIPPRPPPHVRERLLPEPLLVVTVEALVDEGHIEDLGQQLRKRKRENCHENVRVLARLKRTLLEGNAPQCFAPRPRDLLRDEVVVEVAERIPYSEKILPHHHTRFLVRNAIAEATDDATRNVAHVGEAEIHDEQEREEEDEHDDFDESSLHNALLSGISALVVVNVRHQYTTDAL